MFNWIFNLLSNKEETDNSKRKRRQSNDRSVDNSNLTIDSLAGAAAWDALQDAPDNSSQYDADTSYETTPSDVDSYCGGGVDFDFDAGSFDCGGFDSVDFYIQ